MQASFAQKSMSNCIALTLATDTEAMSPLPSSAGEQRSQARSQICLNRRQLVGW